MNIRIFLIVSLLLAPHVCNAALALQLEALTDQFFRFGITGVLSGPAPVFNANVLTIQPVNSAGAPEDVNWILQQRTLTPVSGGPLMGASGTLNFTSSGQDPLDHVSLVFSADLQAGVSSGTGDAQTFSTTGVTVFVPTAVFDDPAVELALFWGSNGEASGNFGVPQSSMVPIPPAVALFAIPALALARRRSVA